MLQEYGVSFGESVSPNTVREKEYSWNVESDEMD